MWLESLRQVLKLVSLIGLLATGPMMVAVAHKEIKDRYPEEVKRYNWIFWIVALISSIAFFAMFQIFYPDNVPIPGRR